MQEQNRQQIYFRRMKTNKSFRNTQNKVNDGQPLPVVLQNMFEQEFHYELFISRCQDTGEKPGVENAKMFKQSYNKINSKKFPHILNLYSMRLGVNTIMKLISILKNSSFKNINLADNSISEYGMHAIKSLINECQIQTLNIASNMISEVGLSLVLEDLIKNTTLKILDLGIMDGSIRKNSIGIDGARCLAAILLQNKNLQSLRLEDNDIGINGAEIISISLKKNTTLKELKISENLIKTQGAEYIFHNATNLEVLDLGKNFIKSSIGPSLEKYLQVNKKLKKINLQLNQLLPEGCKVLFEGVINSTINDINLKGNGMGDRGIQLISDVMLGCGRVITNLKSIDISLNQITDEAVDNLITILDHLQLNTLNLSKNPLGDQGIIELISRMKDCFTANYIEKIDISACKISDRGFMVTLQSLNAFSDLRHIKCVENYISEKYEKIYAQILEKNQTLIHLNLNGNRLSLSGMKVIKKIIDRNLKVFQEKEPKKMESEIKNMIEKKNKVEAAQARLKQQNKEIQKLKDLKTKLQDHIEKVEREENVRRIDFEETVKKRLQQMDQLSQTNTEKIENLQKVKQEKESNLNELNDSLKSLQQRRKQLEYQLNVIKNEGQLLEKQFQNKVGKLQ